MAKAKKHENVTLYLSADEAQALRSDLADAYQDAAMDVELIGILTALNEAL